MGNRRRRVILFCFVLCWGLGQWNGSAGQPQSPEPIQGPGASRRIVLDVVVTDKSGTPVSDLEQQDFTLLDNKQPGKIVSFDAVQAQSAAANTPVEVILLVDAVNTSFNNVGYEREQIVKFLRRGGGQLARPISLVFFTDSGAAISNAPTKDGNALAEQLNRNQTGIRAIGRSQGVYGADERVKLSLHALQQIVDRETARPGRKLLVWISQGWPLLSGPRIVLSPKSQQGIFNSIVGLSDGLRRARITLYAVDPLGTADAGGLQTSYYKEFVKAVKKSSQAQIGNLGLQILAIQSGGRVLNSNNDIGGEIATCIADAKAFYVLGFDGVPGDGPNDYHALEIKVDKPGAVARTRSGYYAQP